MATEAQITANKRNSEASTGPTSETGKKRASLNAVKTGLTARTIVFSPEDAKVYQTLSDHYYSKYSPVDDEEKGLVQIVVDCEWRLCHIAPLEAAIYAGGRDKCAHLVADVQDPAQREALLLAEIYFMFKKDLVNIALQDRRLTNKLDKAVAKLEALQKVREDARELAVTQAKRSIEACKANNYQPDFKFFGFDFSVEEFEEYLVARQNYFTLSGGKTLKFHRFLTENRAQPNAVVAA